MSDSERCHSTAARYARLAELCAQPEKQRAYRDLERLWREMAALVEDVDLAEHTWLRERFDALADTGDLPPRPAFH